jgi:hypothetical protein
VSVNERFHRAKDFFVFDVFPDPSPPVFVERRYFPHSEPMLRDFDGVAALLEDCRHLASLGFVGAAKRALAGKGFALHESRGEIAQVLWDIVSPQHDGEEP